jgi:2-dehydropantoate 2-reductase
VSRYVVYGAGAIGGSLGAALSMSGHDVVLIARGRHQQAIAQNGLRYETPREQVTLSIPSVAHPSELRFSEEDIVLLCTKVQDSFLALDALQRCASRDVPIVCMQNGVEGERIALRQFSNVYAGVVLCPGEHLEPGLVLNRSEPSGGVFDIGRYPKGYDARVTSICEDLVSAGFMSRPLADVMAWKYAKLVGNLVNAIEIVFDTSVTLDGINGTGAQALSLARSEAIAVLQAAHIPVVEAQDFLERVAHVHVGSIPGRSEGHSSSTWQSLARGTSVEAAYLNGEIVLLGRLLGIPTPANALLQELADELARDGKRPGSISEEQFLEMVQKQNADR